MCAQTADKSEIVVVGAGLAGHAAALSLAATGAQTVLLDQAPENALRNRGGGAEKNSGGRAPDMRTTALSASSLKMLTCLQVTARLAHPPAPVSAMRLTEGAPVPALPGGVLQIDGIDGEDAPGALAHMVHNRDLLQAFSKAAAAAPNLEIRQNQNVASLEKAAGAVCLIVNGKPLHCDLVVGCDGRSSLIRDFLGTRVIRKDYGRAALVTNFSHSLPHGNAALQIFRPSGPLACLPLGPDAQGRFQSGLVWVEKSDIADSLASLPPGRFASHLAERLDGALGGINVAFAPQCFPLSLMLAETYAHPHAVLLGDAAHVVHPLAGQGYNLTLRDAASLAEHVFEARLVGLKPSDVSVLEGYGRNRQADAFAMAGLTDGLNRLFGTKAGPLAWLRHAAMDFLNGPGMSGRLGRFARRHADTGLSPAPRLLRGRNFPA